MRLRMRTLMIGVAGAAVLSVVAVHARDVLRTEDDLAGAILFSEGFAASVLATIVFAARLAVGLNRADDAYAARLRRGEVPERCPLHPPVSGPPG